MSNLNNTYDNNDFDSFLNLDNDFTPSLTSPANNTIPSLSHQSSASNSGIISSSQPAFSGPSYQYDSHRQQTGLPMGGLANTFAVNQASGLHYRPGNLGFVMPTETLNVPLSNLDDFDFGKTPYDMNDMDFDAESPSDLSMFSQQGSSQIKTESTQSTPIQRMYPGMHSQKAKQEMLRQQQQQQQQQQQKQVAGQLPLPTQAPKSAKDPHVEESISRLLSRMRQSSTASIDENSSDINGTGLSSIPKPRKDEEDMDEDERLLASEEGKKLSSKERRQLRNKVSARAFRSRRKEYIGQLEGEVAAKVQEANDLRVQNRQLMEENTRLTDLTRMLLSSQAFSGFLQELSNSGMTMPSNVPTQQPQQSQPQRQKRKDISAHEANQVLQSQNQQVGMAMIPETTIDMSDYSTTWNVPLPSNDFQVFSVTTLPEPPTLELSALSEKTMTEKTFSSHTSKLSSEKDALEISSLPPSVEVIEPAAEVNTIANMMDEDSDDLYAPSSTHAEPTPSVQTLLSTLSKPESTIQQSTTNSHTEPETESELSSNLERMCSSLEESFTRLQDFLP